MRYKVLGPVQAERDGIVLGLGGSQQRRLLAVLLASRDRLVTVDRLVEMLWPDGEAPAGASRSTMTYISRLRTALGDGAILTEPAGYRLVMSASSCDADDFNALVDAAERSLPDRAVEHYDDALALWRGEPFEEFAGEWWTLTEAATLRERRLVAREERAAAIMSLGHAARAVADLEALAVAEPLRERPLGLLMQALRSSGRPTDALRRFRAFRGHLVAETGLEPSPELATLSRAIAAGLDTDIERIRVPLRGYVIHDVIGEGAFGRTYRATQPGTERTVAVKAIRPDIADTSEFIGRFEAEARLIARLEHPHIVPLYDYWREPGGAYLVFRYLPGGTARDAVVAGGPWSLHRVGRLVDAIGAALLIAHASGVVHHDVTAANVLLDAEGVAFLTDFGIAVSTHEACPGDQPDVRPDVRSFGWLLWELLSGSTRDGRGSPPSLLGSLAAVPPGLDAVLARATSEQSGYGSIAELMLAWRAATDGVDAARFDSAERLAADSARRHAAIRLAQATAAGVNPYNGLRAFDEADAARFFGRDAAADELHALCRRQRLVCVVGASGSGKSSLVRAGLVPRLRLDGQRVATMVPGNDPGQALIDALRELATETLPHDPLDALRLVASTSGGLVVVIDQFEECWTRADGARRDPFLEGLATAADTPELPLLVVTTIRADLLDRPLEHQRLGPHLATGTFVVAPMTPAELDDSIVLPAAAAGVHFDDSVVAQLVASATAQPGALPLLQFTLSELYDRRVDSRIGPEALEALGGVSGAVGRRAEAVFAALDADAHDHVRELFGRLVVPGAPGPDTRRRATHSELSPAARSVAAAFVEARLLVTDRDPATREPTVEVAHEALLSRWDRLAGWIAEDRRWLTQLQHLANAARAWDQSGRSPAELYRGSRLETAIEAIAAGRIVSGLEREYVEAGRAARDADIVVAQRTARRLRRLLLGVAAALIVALVAGTVAIVQQRRASSSAGEARAAAAASGASARAASIEALVGRVESIRSTQRDTAALLAIEAFRLADTPRTRSALFGTFTTGDGFLDAHRLEQDLGFPGIVVPGGDDRAIIALADGRLRRYDLDTGALGEPWELPGERVDQFPVISASPDGTLIAELPWANDEGTAFIVAIFDAVTGELLVESEPIDGRVNQAAFSTDGSTLLVTADPEQRLVLVDARNGTVIAEGAGATPIEEAFAVDSSARPAPLLRGRFVVGGEAGTVRVVDDHTLEVVATIERPPHTTAVLQPLADGTVVGSGFHGVSRFDLATGEPVWERLAEAQSCVNMAVIESVDAVFCGDQFGRLVRLDLASGVAVGALDAQNGNVGMLWPADDGTELVGFGNNEAVISRWRLDGTGPITTAVAPGATIVAISPDATKLIVQRALTNDVELTTAFDVDNEVVDLATGSVTPLPGIVAPFWVDDDTVVGGAVTDAGLQVVHFDLVTGELIADGVVLAETPRNVAGGTARAEAVLWFEDESGHTTIWPVGTDDGQRHEPTIELDAVVQAAINPAGDRIAVGTASGLIVFDGDTGAELARIDDVEQRGVYITAGNQLFVSSLGGELAQYDLTTAALVRTYGGSRGFIQELTGTADGTLLAARGGDRTVALYDAATGVRIGAPIVIDDRERAFADLSLDGSLLAVGGGVDDPVRLWDLDPQHWITAACRLAGRNLTEQEWADNIGNLADYHPTCPEIAADDS